MKDPGGQFLRYLDLPKRGAPSRHTLRGYATRPRRVPRVLSRESMGDIAHADARAVRAGSRISTTGKLAKQLHRRASSPP